MTAKIQSVNVTVPRFIVMKGKQVATTIWKRAVSGKVAVDRGGLVGESRIARSMCDADDHALSFYPHEHYAHWQRELGCEDFPYGQFGENLTCSGLLETEVHLGDVWRCGEVVVRVRQPRLPCAKLDARMGRRFAGRFLRSRRVGFLTSVLAPGQVAAGDLLELVERDPDEPTVDDLFRLTQLDTWDAEGLAHLLESRWLPEPWRELVAHKWELARDAEGWHGLRPLQVVERQPQSEQVVSLWLACPRGKPLAPFLPGQYVMVAWRPGPDDSVLRRPYALTSDPRDLSRYRISVARVPAGALQSDRPAGVVSSALHDVVRPGDTLLVAAPRGHTTLAAVTTPCRGLLFLSEGIGAATVLPLLREWARRFSQVPAVHLHVASAAAQVALFGELSPVEGTALRRIVMVRDGVEGAAAEGDGGAGVPAALRAASLRAQVQDLAAGAEHVFVAGSSEFVDEVSSFLRDTASQLHVERFGELR